jgi:hypothetical protein
MRAFSISSDGKLVITASETSSTSDFDYLIGNWNIRNRTLKEPLTGSDEWDEFDATQEFRPILLGPGTWKRRFIAVHSPLTQAERGNGIGTHTFHDGDRLGWSHTKSHSSSER